MQIARFQIKSISFRNVRPYLARSIAAETGGTLFALVACRALGTFPVRVRDLGGRPALWTAAFTAQLRTNECPRIESKRKPYSMIAIVLRRNSRP